MLQTSLHRNNLSMISSPGMKTSSSRSTRVIEELQENWENIQKELQTTKVQLESLKAIKEENEKQNEEYIEANKKLRADIHEIMQILETKQGLLDSTKKNSLETENKVKELKNEAMAARKELDDLKRRERTIEKERHTILAQKEQAAQQSEALKKQVSQSEAAIQKEIQELQLELAQVKEKTAEIKAIDVTDLVQKALEEQNKQKEKDIKEFEVIKSRMEANNQRFIAQIREQIQQIMDEARPTTTGDWDTKVNDCKDDVNGLVARIKAGSAVYL